MCAAPLNRRFFQIYSLRFKPPLWHYTFTVAAYFVVGNLFTIFLFLSFLFQKQRLYQLFTATSLYSDVGCLILQPYI
jgi:hypothetical protein